MENSTVGKRLKTLLNELVVSQSEFAKNVGITTSALSQIINDRVAPHFSTIKKMVLAYPQINETWLATGKGEMFKLTITNQPASRNVTAAVESSSDNYLDLMDDKGLDQLSKDDFKELIKFVRNKINMLTYENERLRTIIFNLTNLGKLNASTMSLNPNISVLIAA